MKETIEGMQEAGVQACAKHYIGNEQEKNRDTMGSNIPDRVMHELYLWPFADAVKANVASVMCRWVICGPDILVPCSQLQATIRSMARTHARITVSCKSFSKMNSVSKAMLCPIGTVFQHLLAVPTRLILYSPTYHDR